MRCREVANMGGWQVERRYEVWAPDWSERRAWASFVSETAARAAASGVGWLRGARVEQVDWQVRREPGWPGAPQREMRRAVVAVYANGVEA